MNSALFIFSYVPTNCIGFYCWCVVLQTSLGIIKGTVHAEVLEKLGGNIPIGSTMLLSHISVLSPNPRHHYLNITLSNIISLYGPDGLHLGGFVSDLSLTSAHICTSLYLFVQVYVCLYRSMFVQVYVCTGLYLYRSMFVCTGLYLFVQVYVCLYRSMFVQVYVCTVYVCVGLLMYCS